MRISVAVAHAAFDARRAPGVERIRDTLRDRVYVQRSERPEPASRWAQRLWTWVACQDVDVVVLLNDDVLVTPDLVEAVRAMDTRETVSLHCSLPVARSLAEAGMPWARSYWLTGPGYTLTPRRAQTLLRWWRGVPRAVSATWNEDNCAIHWAYSRRKPFLQAIPALVSHDTSMPSTLGYDLHRFRQTEVPWFRYPAPITDPEYWRNACAPVIENPWGGERSLAGVDRQIMMGSVPGPPRTPATRSRLRPDTLRIRDDF